MWVAPSKEQHLTWKAGKEVESGERDLVGACLGTDCVDYADPLCLARFCHGRDAVEFNELETC